MKFIVSSSALLSLLQTSGKAISNKNTLPILDYFLLDLKDGKLIVTASDLETTLVGSINVESIEREGIIAAPAKLMLDSLKEFSEQPLEIDVNDSTWEIKVSWKSGHITLPGTSGMSYPTIPTLTKESKTITIGTTDILNGINKTIFATADDDLRPIMNGIYICIEESQTIFVATDAHKLVKVNTLEQSNGVNSSFILPKKPANLLRNILIKENDSISVSFDSKNVIFTLSNHTLICRLIEGNYPNYNAVIPSTNPNKLIIDRVELLNGIKRVAVCSNQATNLIRFDIAEGKVSLTAQDLDFSVSASEALTCSYDGDPITIGLKSTFLVEILSNIETQTVLVELADSTRAGVFKPIYDDEQSTETLMLLMPMMINA